MQCNVDNPCVNRIWQLGLSTAVVLNQGAVTQSGAASYPFYWVPPNIDNADKGCREAKEVENH